MQNNQANSQGPGNKPDQVKGNDARVDAGFLEELQFHLDVALQEMKVHVHCKCEGDESGAQNSFKAAESHIQQARALLGG